jgi:phage-related protein (TIGR01555 family)
MRRLTELGLDRLRHIHHSRVIRFDGVEVPPDLMIRRRGWSQSLINLLWDSFQRYETGGKGSSAMIAAFDLFIYKMQGLRSISTMDNGESEIRERFKLLQLSMSQFKGLIMDSTEDAQFISRTFAGISDILEHLKSDLIGATGIPHTVMFGESPSGLGATGESEERTWANQCSAYQESKLRPKLTQIMELIWLAEDGPTGGKIPKDWGFTFQSLIQESQKEVLENRSAQSSIDNTYFQAGILLPEEIRNSRFGGDQFSFETQIDDKLWKQKKKEEEEAKAAEMATGTQESYDPFAAYATEQPAGAESNGNGNGKPDNAQKSDSLDDFEMIAIAETRRNFKFPESEYAKVWRENRIKELSRN